MSISQKIKNEIKALAATSLYFAVWLSFLVTLKKLILAEYQIEYYGLSKMLVGILVLAKVVLVLEHVSLGAWIRSRPTWVNVLLRTLLYSAGVLIVLVLEKAFEGRHEHGGFVSSLSSVFQHVDINHVWANAMCVSGALLVYNVIFVIGEHLGPNGLWRLFISPLPNSRTDGNNLKGH